MAIKTIISKGKERCIFKEGIASAAITPGHLLQGLPAALAVHAGQALTAMRMFAVERDLTGDEIGDAYAQYDTVLYAVCPPGTELQAIADGSGVTAGDYVESAGDGTFQTRATDAATDDTQRGSTVGRALTTAAADARFTLEVL